MTPLETLVAYFDKVDDGIEIAHAGDHLGMCSMDPPYPTREQVLEYARGLSAEGLAERVTDLDQCPW